MALNLGGKTQESLGFVEERAEQLQDALDPFSPIEQQKGQIPFYGTGARALIRVGGRPAGLSTNFRWQVAYSGEPINTVDTPHPWDIDVGQMTVNGTLNNIFDPTKGPEAHALAHIMESAIHQPLVEIQVLDKLGTSLFFARGMFLQVNGNVARGQVSSYTAQFRGVAYQHYVSQEFKPYSGVAASVDSFTKGLQNLASDVSGGIL